MAHRTRIKIAALVTALFIAALIAAGVGMRSTAAPHTATTIAPVTSPQGQGTSPQGQGGAAAAQAEDSEPDDDEDGDAQDEAEERSPSAEYVVEDDDD
jgi:hypothetical protein